mmetsp:Transcript_7924/g.17269  ORF Transcript_7924/g.17269 Transcript_7924/m.17269 type:complete len:1163 (-) Transcript_7924:567-4055(-)
MDSFLRNGINLQSMYSGKGIPGIAGDAHFFEDITTPAKVRQNLDSSQESDKLKGMKLLLAMLSKGKDIPEFFPDVVKNVVVKNIEVKKMVYIYLVHYADFDDNCREIALLSINSFQKDMSGDNQLIRGMALRVMTSIRVHDIIQIQLLAVQKCAVDNSPYVRKCAANAVSKIHALDIEQNEHLREIVQTLLKDSSTMVLGSAMVAFNAVCPDAFDLIHSNYRKLCHLLADMDEWTQVSVLEILTRYTRNQFTDPTPGASASARLQAMTRSNAAVTGRLGSGSSSKVKRRVVKKAFYSDEEDESGEEEAEVMFTVPHPEVGSLFTGGDADNDGDLNPDHRLALKSSLPLLKSRNAAVVLAVCSLHFYCGTQSIITAQQIGKALVRILRNRRETQFVVLSSINAMVRERPAMFRPFLSDFFVKASDPLFTRLLKLEILTSLSYKDNIHSILREFQTYVKDSNEEFVCTTVRAIGRIADSDPSVSSACMEGIMHLLLCSKSDVKLSACVVALRQMLQQNSKSPTSFKILRQLVKLLLENGVVEPVARSSIVWLTGEFQETLAEAGPDALRILAAGFADESTEAKVQILNLAIKQSLHFPSDDGIQQLMTYVLEMSRYDVDTDLRDRSRFMTAMMGLAPSNETEGSVQNVDDDALAELSELSSGIMLAPKLPPVTLLGVDMEGVNNFNVGSLSAIVGHTVAGYQPLQSWADSQADSGTRDEKVEEVAEKRSSMFEARRPDADLGIFYGNNEEVRKPRVRADSSSSESRAKSSSGDSGSSSDSDSSDRSYSSSSSSSSGSSKRSAPAAKSPDASKAGTGMRQQQGMRKVTGRRNDLGDVLVPMTTPQWGMSAGPLLSEDLIEADLLNAAMPIPYNAGDELLSFENTAPPTLGFLPLTGGGDAVSSIMSSFDGRPLGTSGTSDFQAAPPATSASMSTTGTTATTSRGMFAPIEGVRAGQEEFLSAPKQILRPEMGSGLSVSLVLRNGTPPASIAGAVSAYIHIKNTRDDLPIRRVKICFPPEVRCTGLPDIPVLEAGQEIRLPLEITLSTSNGKLLKVDIRCDKGSFNGALLLEGWDLLLPHAMKSADFEAIRGRLGGFSEISKTHLTPSLNLGSPNAEEVRKRVRSALNVFEVQGVQGGEMRFAGSLRKGLAEQKLLITVVFGRYEL